MLSDESIPQSYVIEKRKIDMFKNSTSMLVLVLYSGAYIRDNYIQKTFLIVSTGEMHVRVIYPK